MFSSAAPRPRDALDSASQAAESGGAPSPTPTTVVVINRFPASEVLRAALVLFGVVAGVIVLWRIQEVIILLILAILLATAIEPLVMRLRRGPFSRGGGVLAVYTLIVLVLGVPSYLAFPSLAGQVSTFTDSLPRTIVSLRQSAVHLQPSIVRESALAALDQINAMLHPSAPPPRDQIVAASTTALQTLVGFVTIFVVAFYWLVERPMIKRVVLRAVPAEQAHNVNTIWVEVEEKLGGWVRGELLLMLAVGLLAGAGFLVLGLPSPLLLAIIAGLFEIVPMLGPVLAFAPAVLVALTLDPSKAVIVVVYAIVVEQFEANVLVPRIMNSTVGVSPLTVILGILIGSVAYGLPGAFLAVPIAGALQVILAHTLRSEDPAQAEAHPTAEERVRQETGGRENRAAA